MEDNFKSTLPSNALEFLLRIGTRKGFDPVGSAESEAFFEKLVRNFDSLTPDERELLSRKIGGVFRCIGDLPRWIQNPDWQFSPSGPMVFAGQIPIPKESGHFHDDAVFYVFWDPESGLTKTVL
jgi:hypothetical protein